MGNLETKMPMMTVTKKSVPIKQRENTGFMDSKTRPRKNIHNKSQGEK